MKAKSLLLPLAVLTLLAFFAGSARSQTNSYISSTDGFWDEARFWSLAQPPSIAQSAILITNAASLTVTIDSITANSFTSTLIISNLTVSAPTGITATLYLDNTGTIALQVLDGLTIGVTDERSPVGGSELISTNSTLVVDGLLGGQLQDNGTMVITGGSLITTNCSLLVAASPYLDFPPVGLLIISNGVVQARDVTITSGSSSRGTIEVFGGTMTLSSSLSVGGGPQSQASVLVANGGLLVVTNDETDIGGEVSSQSTLTVSNATFLAADVVVSGQRSFAGLTINNGTVTASGEMVVGGPESGGEVFLNGGILTVTNATAILGSEGSGEITISDGLFLTRDVVVGPFLSSGTLTINGGISIISSNLLLGSGPGDSDATVSITGGQLFVTNGLISVSDAVSDAFGITNFEALCSVSGGQLAAKTIELGRFSSYGGELTVDGGSVTVSDGMTLGDCTSNTIGVALVDGGQLIVTNATSTGFIDIQNGQLVLSNGVLQVDKLVMTNSCSQFIHPGGTLIVGSVVLDPNAFRMTSVAREGNDLRVTWLMAPGQTNALQATSGGTQGCYTTNGFTDIFIVTNNTTTGSLTNYLDIGAATNIPSRFYRARLSP